MLLKKLKSPKDQPILRSTHLDTVYEYGIWRRRVDESSPEHPPIDKHNLDSCVFYWIESITHLVIVCGRFRFICIVLLIGNGMDGLGYCCIIWGMIGWLIYTTTNTTLLMMLMRLGITMIVLNILMMFEMMFLLLLLMVMMMLMIMAFACILLFSRAGRFVMNNNAMLFPISIFICLMMVVNRFIIVLSIIMAIVIIYVVLICIGTVFVVMGLSRRLRVRCDTVNVWLDMWFNRMVLLLIVNIPWIDECSMSDLWMEDMGIEGRNVKELWIFIPFWLIIISLIIPILWVCVCVSGSDWSIIFRCVFVKTNFVINRNI